MMSLRRLWNQMRRLRNQIPQLMMAMAAAMLMLMVTPEVMPMSWSRAYVAHIA